MGKIVVFDLDETLGYFVEFSIFWDALHSYISEKEIDLVLDKNMFIKILNLYPEFIRPNILSILNYLKYMKSYGFCDSVIIYTNNQGPKIWAEYIQSYFENKLNYKLFNQIIGAFKVNGKRIELCRTSHEKSIHDLLKCTKMPKNTEICFLDDLFFPGMKGKNVYYIKINPYVHNISFEELAKRSIDYFRSQSVTIFSDEKEVIFFKEFIVSFMNHCGFHYIEKTNEEYEIDKIITKKAMIHLQSFFNQKWRENDNDDADGNARFKNNTKNKKTRKSNHRARNKTYKNTS